MRIIPRRSGQTPADDGIPPHATSAPRRAPSWPGETAVNEDPFWAPVADAITLRLPVEDRDLLVAYPDAPSRTVHPFLTALALAAAARRPGCRILAASREFEVAVGQNLAMLADQDHVPAAVTL